MAASPASLDVVCVVLSRAQAREEHRAQDYRVYLLEGNGLPTGEVRPGEEPETSALRIISERAGLRGCTAVSLAVLCTQNKFAVLYAVPVASSVVPSSRGQFYSLSSAMEDQSMNHEHRNMLSSVDQWLRERHALPFLDPSLYFLGGEEEGGVGGVVRAVIENPVFLCSTPPPEDKLVISLNNPTFSSTHSTVELHATHA